MTTFRSIDLVLQHIKLTFRDISKLMTWVIIGYQWGFVPGHVYTAFFLDTQYC